MGNGNKKNKISNIIFEEKLILFKYFLYLIGEKDFKAFLRRLNSGDAEGYAEDGRTEFFHRIARHMSIKLGKREAVSFVEKMKEYDDNIVRHTKHIEEKREEKIAWKYYQYLSLLFTEIYLDNYFNNRKEFIDGLNKYLSDYNQDREKQQLEKIPFSTFTEKDLNKIAFMCATGSGKTLIMHVNILQYIMYFEKAKAINSKLTMNKIILLTPNEGLSHQHLEELKLSNIDAMIFSKENAIDIKDQVNIIDINKLKEEGKVKTVAVDSFESNNLVLVDEGHKGLSGDVWYSNRQKLMADGFSFEYSATFKQAVGDDDEALAEEYGKSIIFDYSYKFFHDDGYGKEYRILNLKDEVAVPKKQLYLTGCLIAFYQQLKIHTLKNKDYIEYNIEKPLLVFVGNRVTAIAKGSSLTNDIKDLLSDVEAIVQFIDGFVKNDGNITKRNIEAILNNDTGLIDANGKDLFENKIEVLSNLLGNDFNADYIYKDILKLIFQSDNIDTPRLHLNKMTQIGDEIGLRIGESDYFGVISIGDITAFNKMCAEKGIVTESDEVSKESLFEDINKKDSNITMLIGSRKFSEGWNSFRVSTMGLINFAKGEGSQAIQLFGRGVRLHGYNNSLLRSDSERLLSEGITTSDEIKILETLNIFGVKAQYMEDFKNFLEKEQLGTKQATYDYKLPIKNRYEELNCKNLKVIRLKEGYNYKKQAEKYVLDVPDEDFKNYLLKSKTKLDLRSMIQTIISTESNNVNDVNSYADVHTIDVKDIQYLNFDRIYIELVEYKNSKSYFNIIIDKSKLKDILSDNSWYELKIAKNQIELDSVEKIEKITDYAILLLKSYIDKNNRFYREKWEVPNREYDDLKVDDQNFDTEYVLSYTPKINNGERIEENINTLDEFAKDMQIMKEINYAMNEGKWSTKDGDFKNKIFVLYLNRHLFSPLIHIEEDVQRRIDIKTNPVALNDGENTFITKLANFYKEQNTEGIEDKSILEESNLYLLRNKPRKGIGFFEGGNFYPDFIMWIDKPNAQYITFIDPKGLMMLNPDNPKLEFYKTIKDIQNGIVCKDKKIILNSFILSINNIEELKATDEWKNANKKDLNDMNILFINDDDCIKQLINKIK